MLPLPLLGALIDTAGAAIKAVRNSGSSAASATPAASAGNDSASGPAAVPFAQTLKQSVASRHDAASGDTSDGATSSTASTSAPNSSTSTTGTNPSKPSGNHDDKSTDDANATPNPDAAALAAAVAMQAQLQARVDNPAPAAADAAATAAGAAALAGTAVAAGQPDATAALAHQAGTDAAATPVAPAAARDALQAALAKLSGDAGAIALPAGAAGTSSAAAPTAAGAQSTPTVPTFDRTLADAKGALATQQTPAQAAASALQAGAGGQSAAQHGFGSGEQAASPAADATAAAATAAATAAAAAQANVQASPVAGSIAAANAHVLAPHVGTADWTDALSQKVVFLSNAHQQSAELTLNPPDLGPLQVVLRVADNHAHALFVSQHPQVRDAVEAALPKLREAMEAGGLGLGSATVSDGGFGSQQNAQQQAFAGGRPASRARAGSSGADAPLDAAPSAAAAATVSRAGLVDTFA
ncbi:flagellar hook-length control protein FliK [Burkholderia vietnamiensis]|uniref:flagellar hook-length control protein FliK n=1 Tax=Burkholderia vietnamiensis TaxID=60552 RepID=UPI001CF2E73C|nr:flagellar hook-length control protein FliK [Burkholderia vietnamiensis]MCA8011136.1 flagellar hook-length control protein FliK [Burkholderia vietnamiensis]HDR8941664.1 flagellar hook-length control protein FliK [Burkholderia vietnamiensis]